MFLFKSGLPMDDIEKTSESRADQYRQVPGLVQKYYVLDKGKGRVGGVFVFDSQESLLAFRESDLAKSTGEAYKFLE
ncbi:MAG: YdhR family protein, partial [Candidatus Thorarchaeota archaeon]